MKKSIATALVLLSSVLGMPALAQVGLDAPGDAPLAQPTSAWLVGSAGVGDISASLAGEGMKMPCIAANQYDDGTLVRFSGGGGKLVAMAVVFRDPLFKEGMKYDLALSVPPGFETMTQAFAHDQRTIIVSLSEFGEAYSALSTAPWLRMHSGQASYRFSLQGLYAGFQQMESCYAPESARETRRGVPEQAGLQSLSSTRVFVPEQAQEPVEALEDVPSLTVLDTPPPSREMIPVREVREMRPIPPVFDASQTVRPVTIEADLKVQDGKATMTLHPSEGVSDLAPSAGSEASSPVRWTARKGELVRDVVERWSRISGTNLVWSASDQKTVREDFASRAPFDVAIQVFLSQQAPGLRQQYGVQRSQSPVSREEKPEIVKAPVYYRDSSHPQATAQPIPITVATSSVPGPVVSSGSEAYVSPAHRWRALRGSSLREVLTVWAEDSGADFVWTAPGDYVLKDSVSVKSGLEDAIATALGQFAGTPGAPSSRILLDPQRGRKVIFIRGE